MNDQNDTKATIEPVRLTYDSRFTFKCHQNIKCFTHCCRGINIILTPYDLLHLKNRIGISSTEFLNIYTKPELLEKTDLPVVTLKLLDDEKQSCPFVRDDGCLFYEDRPSACRYYPLGMASLMHREELDDEGFFFFVHEPHCLGFEEKQGWTVRDWRQDQGVDIRDEINAGWADLIVRKRSFPAAIHLTEKSKDMFFMACYDVDRFRRFVLDSAFLDRMDIAPETVEKIKSDEVELLKFAFDWIKWALYKIGDFKLRA